MKLKVLICAATILTCVSSIPTPAFTEDRHTTVTSRQEDDNNPTVVKKRFKAIIDIHTLKLSENIKIPRQGYNIYTKDITFHAELLEETEYDINKTDSIISPYTGIVKFYFNWYANNKFSSKQYILAKYAYQDGNWVLKSALRSHQPGKFNTDKEDVDWVSSLFK